MSTETVDLEAVLEIPNDHLDVQSFQIELDCGVMAGQITEISRKGITLRASESLSYARSPAEHRKRLAELKEDHPEDGDDRWIQHEGTTAIGGERLVKEVYAYQKFSFDQRVESVDGLVDALDSL